MLEQIQNRFEQVFKSKTVSITYPTQGMDNQVLFAKLENGNEYVIKIGNYAYIDDLALTEIEKYRFPIPIPKVYDSFEIDGNTILILEKIKYPLLNDIEDKALYIKPMIDAQKLIHKIKSNTISLEIDNRSWKQFLLDFYNGNNSLFNWDEISRRPGIDTELIIKAVNYISSEISKREFISEKYSLLHTDFNQRNLFVNESDKSIAGIIDWSEAMYGDPLYDFVRIRMFIWHFELGEDSLEVYYKELGLTQEQEELENLYLMVQVLNYINWYSEKLTAFDKKRIEKHQNLLREYLA